MFACTAMLLSQEIFELIVQSVYTARQPFPLTLALALSFMSAFTIALSEIHPAS